MTSDVVATEIDLYDISGMVWRVDASSSLVPHTHSGFTNGESYFFDHSVVTSMAETTDSWQLIRRIGGGWQESASGRSPRALAERHINGVVHFRFRDYWGFAPVAGPPRMQLPGGQQSAG